MRTTLDIPEELLEQAMKLAKVRTKTQVVILALRDLIDKERREGLIALKGTLDLDVSTDETRRSKD